MPVRSDGRFSLGTILLGGFVALSIIIAALLSASPALHEQVHPGGDAASHLCAVTLVGSGHCYSAVPAPVFCPPAALPMGAAPLCPGAGNLFSPHVSSVLEHAPPVFA
jgi:hypothetical protein